MGAQQEAEVVVVAGNNGKEAGAAATGYVPAAIRGPCVQVTLTCNTLSPIIWPLWLQCIKVYLLFLALAALHQRAMHAVPWQWWLL